MDHILFGFQTKTLPMHLKRAAIINLLLHTFWQVAVVVNVKETVANYDNNVVNLPLYALDTPSEEKEPDAKQPVVVKPEKEKVND